MAACPILGDSRTRSRTGTTVSKLYGLVARAYVVRFKYTGKSAGYGFVEMGSGEQALNAVVALEGTEWDGHLLRLYVTPYANQAV